MVWTIVLHLCAHCPAEDAAWWVITLGINHHAPCLVWVAGSHPRLKVSAGLLLDENTEVVISSLLCARQSAGE
eukprot:5688400-Amphidinium_carterae.1